MRHRVKGRHLSRTSSHRVALRRNLAASLFTHGRIITTLPKAKEVKPFVEKLITLARKAVSKRDTDKAAYVHYYRMILSRLRDKEMVKKLVGEGKWREDGGIAQRYLTRNGGYTRIMRLSGSRLGVLTGGKVGKVPVLEYKMGGVNRKLRLVGNRLGDNADRVIFELVEGLGEEPKKEEAVEPKAEAPKVETKKTGRKRPQAAKAEATKAGAKAPKAKAAGQKAETVEIETKEVEAKEKEAKAGAKETRVEKAKEAKAPAAQKEQKEPEEQTGKKEEKE
ncbi:MAG: 50S ribosomal protein L17 [Candidatus Brocadiales bacterium]|nr:50S ribosomal protein L17 [Candidatus Bathyanammoxibius amoris]